MSRPGHFRRNAGEGGGGGGGGVESSGGQEGLRRGDHPNRLQGLTNPPSGGRLVDDARLIKRLGWRFVIMKYQYVTCSFTLQQFGAYDFSSNFSDLVTSQG